MMTTNLKALIKSAIQILLCMCLAGCLSPVKLTPNNNYFLNTLPDRVPSYRTHSATILVLTPDVREAFDTTQMAYSLHHYEVSYYGLNQWAELPGRMLQPLIVQTLQNTHYFHAVVAPPYLGQADYMLKTQVLDLRQDYSQQYRTFKLSIRAQLIRVSTGRVMATKLINVSEPIPNCTPYSGVQAGNRAEARALREIAVFTVNAIS